MIELDRNHRPAPLPSDVSRRTIARAIVPGGLLAALLIHTVDHGARAQATPEAASDAAGETGPHRFVLRGATMEIRFEPATNGAARLDVRDATQTLTFTGDELDLTHHATLGLTVSALIEAVPDGYVRYLTLLVPEVNPVAGQSDVPIQTLAIATTHRTSIGGPRLVEGPLQTYESVALEGVAEFAPA